MLFIPTVIVCTAWYLRFYYYHWVDTTADEILVPDGIRPVVDGLLAIFIIEIYSS